MPRLCLLSCRAHACRRGSPSRRSGRRRAPRTAPPSNYVAHCVMDGVIYAHHTHAMHRARHRAMQRTTQDAAQCAMQHASCHTPRNAPCHAPHDAPYNAGAYRAWPQRRDGHVGRRLPRLYVRARRHVGCIRSSQACRVYNSSSQAGRVWREYGTCNVSLSTLAGMRTHACLAALLALDTHVCV